MIENIYWSSCKVPVILVRYEGNLNLSTDFGKIPKFHENPSSGSQVVP